MKVLVCYHSDDGQTAKVAGRISAVLIDKGCTVDVATAEDNPSPADYDGIIFGDSIHAGRHSRSLRRWIARHEDELDPLPKALFQVSLTSSKDDDESVAEAHRLVQQLLDTTRVEPDLVGLFAGALVYTRYGWLKRTMMSRIARAEDGDADTSKDYEYTDWEAVEQFAADAVSIFATTG
ncbi:MAG: protoporphyrinogen oxidase [Acidimicrobiia bacterium]|nr:protoporphyrinogen oxidase [Acidimicrobiia bacterium]MDH5521313.1 protoporphyrinogen oxidase [Acidimicrobiia bacterium]